MDCRDYHWDKLTPDEFMDAVESMFDTLADEGEAAVMLLLEDEPAPPKSRVMDAASILEAAVNFAMQLVGTQNGRIMAIRSAAVLLADKSNMSPPVAVFAWALRGVTESFPAMENAPKQEQGEQENSADADQEGQHDHQG